MRIRRLHTFRSVWIAALLAACFALPAAARTHSALIDADRDPATGCSVASAAGTVDGIEWSVSAFVSGLPPQVDSVELSRCEGGNFVAVADNPGGYPVGLDIGPGGSDVVEFAQQLGQMSALEDPVTLHFLSETASGADLVGGLVLGVPGAGEPPAVPTPRVIPTLHWLGLSLVVFAVLLMARRHRALRGVAAVFLLLGAGLVWAANFLADGQIGDWSTESPLGSDAANDSSSGEAGIEIVSVWAATEGGRAFFRVDVANAENEPPTATPLAANTLEDQAVVLSLSGSDTEGDALTFAVVAGPGSGTLGPIVSTGPSTAEVTYTPAADFNGSDAFDFTVNDGVNDSAPATVALTITAVNDAPGFAAQDANVFENGGAQTATVATAISAGPADESAQVLSFEVVGNSNPALFSLAPSIAADGTLGLTPAPDTSGSATLSVQLRDDGGTANGGVDVSAPQDIVVTVQGVNKIPSFTSGGDVAVLEDAAPFDQAWATALDDGDGGGQTLSFVITGNTNAALFASGPSIDGVSGNLSFTLAPDANGSATVTVVLQDDGGSANGGIDSSAPLDFAITAGAVNDAPGFAFGAPPASGEDAGPQLAQIATALSTGPANESGQTLTGFTLLQTGIDATLVFAVPPSVSATGELSYTAAPNAWGSASFDLSLSDDGGTADGGADTSPVQTFAIVVQPINDAPAFTAVDPPATDEDAGAVTVPAWVTAFDPGPNEAGQGVFEYVVTVSANPSLFSVTPALSAAGELSYTAAPDAFGVATISVAVRDDGGTALGGIDLSAAQSFDITVNPINDAPVLDLNGPAAGVDFVSSYVEGGGPIAMVDSAALTVLDVDSAQLQVAFATLIAQPALDSVLAVTVGASGLVANFDSSGVLTISGLAPVSTYQDVLRTLTYDNTSNNPPDVRREIALIVQDAEGAMGSASAFVDIQTVNTAPSFTPGGSVTVNEDSGAYDVAWATGMSDNDGGTQTLLFVVDSVSDPSLFSVAPSIDATSGNLQFGTAPDASGTATVQLRLTDSGSDNNSSAPVGFDITLTPVADAPVGVDDAFNTPEETALNVPVPGVLGNDSDADANPLTAVLVSGPSNASGFTLNADGSFSYTPNPAFNGADGFTYRADDGGLQSGVVTVTITVDSVPDAPVAADDAFVTDEDVALNVPLPGVLGNDTDADLDPLDAVLVTGPGNAASFTLNLDGSFSYTPAAEFSGADSFSYRANDGALDSNIATVAITVNTIDDAPVAVADAATVVEDSGASVVDVLSNDTDVDGGSISITAVTQPANGTVVILGGGTGLTYQPNANYCNDPPGPPLDTFSYTLAPGGSGASVALTVTCVDDDPVALADLAVVVEDSGANAIDVLANDTDVDGGSISITAVTQPGSGTVMISGGGTGLSYQPNADYCNTPPGTTPDSFTYSLAPGGSSTSVSVAVTCVDDPPVAVADAATVLEDAAAVVIDVLVNDSDVDGGAFNITSVTQPDNGTVVITGGGTALTYQPDANYCNAPPGTALDGFNYTLAPGGASATVSVTVTCVNDLPALGVDPVSYATAGNTQLHVAGATLPGLVALSDADSLLSKATPSDIDGPAALTVVAGTVASTNGGSATTFTDGSFTYVPPAGFSGPDSFTYAVSDGTDSVNGTVNITVSEVVWYVRDIVDVNNPAAGDTGTSANAFETLADAQTASGDNHIIFVFRGNTGTTPLGGGIALKNAQKLHGEGIGLTHPTHGLLVPAGTRPHITNATAGGNGVTVLANAAGNRTGIEIRGLQISGNTNAIDLTSADAAQLGVRISENAISAAGAEGIDVNIGSSDAVQTLAVHDNTLLSTGTALDVTRTNGTLAITNFANNGVGGDTGGSGLVVTGPSVVFDATPGGAFDPVSGGALVVGASGNGVGASGLRLVNVTGDLGFDSVNVFAGAGTGVEASSTGAFTGNAGLRLRNLAPNTGTVQASGGPAVSLNNLTADLRLGTLTSSGSPTTGVNLVNLLDGTGTTAQFAAAAGSSIASATGTAFNVDGGNATVLYAGMLNNTAGRSVAVQNRTADTTTFTGAISDTGQGVLLNANNVLHTSSFRGGLSLTTGANAAFTATGGGTLEVCDESPCNAAATGALVNTLATTTASALSLTGTTISSNRLEFRSIASNGGNSTGIILDGTGALGGLSVKGTGAAGSGGSITNKAGANGANTTGVGIYLNETGAVSLSSMNLSNFENFAIRGFGVNGFALANSTIGSTVGKIGNSDVDNEGAIAFGSEDAASNGLTGVVSITSTLVEDGFENNIYVFVNSGALSQFTLDGVTVRDTSTVSPGNNGLEFRATGTASLVVDVLNSTFTRNRSNGIQVTNIGGATVDVEIGGANAGSGGSYVDNNIGVNIASSSGAVTYGVRNGTFDPSAVGFASPVNLNLGVGGTTLSGVVASNIISNGQSPTGPGIRALGNGTGTFTTLLQGNSISEVGNFGIEAVARDGSNRLNITAHGNVISLNDPLSIDALRINAGTVSTDTTTVCADINGDNLGGNANQLSTTVAGETGIQIRERFAGTTFLVEDYAGLGTDYAALHAFLSARNSGATVEASDPPGAAYGTIAECPLP